MLFIPCPLCGKKEHYTIHQSFDYKVSKKWFTIVKCKKCDFVFINPRPKKEEILKFYPRKYMRHKPIKVGSFQIKYLVTNKRKI